MLVLSMDLQIVPRKLSYLPIIRIKFVCTPE